MFKKLSSFLMVFAVAVSLTGMSAVESNAQEECGTCGTPACSGHIDDGGIVKNSYEPWYDIWAGPRPNFEFISSDIRVVESCLVCQNPQNTEETELSFLPQLAFPPAQIFSPAEDLVPLGDGDYSLVQKACSFAGEVLEECGECVGNVNELTLKYNGSSAAWIAVWAHKIIPIPVFLGVVEAGAEFTVAAKVDINADSRPAITIPIRPTGTKFFIAYGKINSKSTLSPIAFNSGLKNAKARTINPIIII